MVFYCSEASFSRLGRGRLGGGFERPGVSWGVLGASWGGWKAARRPHGGRGPNGAIGRRRFWGGP